MKHIKQLLLLLLFSTLFVLGCTKVDDNDDKTDFFLSGETLKQTVWTGTFTHWDGEEKEVTLFFRSNEDLEYSSGVLATVSKYTANKNLINIKDNIWGLPMGGYWLATKKSKNDLQLEKEIGTQYHTIMTLTRTYP